MSAVEDAALIASVARGDDRAFETLVYKYEQRLRRYVRTFVRDEEKAKELVQDTFVKVYRNAHRFEPKASFATWLFRIAHNTAISYLRKKKLPLTFGFGNYDPDSDQPAGDVATDELGPYERALGGEIGQMIRNELERLPDKLREAFVLFDVEQNSIKEISAITGSPEGTIKARIFRARRALRERLAGYVERAEHPDAEMLPGGTATKPAKV